MGLEDIVIFDVGVYKMWIVRYYYCECFNICLIFNGFAVMGIVILGVIAVKLVYFECKVVVVMGDGGFMMNC